MVCGGLYAVICRTSAWNAMVPFNALTLHTTPYPVPDPYQPSLINCLRAILIHHVLRTNDVQAEYMFGITHRAFRAAWLLLIALSSGICIIFALSVHKYFARVSDICTLTIIPAVCLIASAVACVPLFEVHNRSPIDIRAGYARTVSSRVTR